jgi:hypothetical protein
MKKRIGAGLVLLGLLVVAGTAAQVVPMAVSPGSERGVALVGQTCPTFSWTAVDWASGYRVAVFDALGVQIPSYEEMAAGAVPVLSKEIAGRALSWTPSSEEQLSGGSLYVWYVQAADGSGQGTWSKGRLFIVEAGVVASGREGWLKKTLEEKGVREDVISDVLKEMKVEGQGILSEKTDAKPQGKVGALGSEGPNNVLYGTGAGASITSGAYNTFIGIWAGAYTTTGNYNTFLGQNSGSANTTGTDNTFLGFEAGYSNTTASCNTFVGYLAGYQTTTGSNNTFLGFEAGRSGSGSNNVFLGYRAGYSETGSDKLYIANSDTSAPLVYGDFSSGILGLNGWLGVGTQSPNYPIELKTTGRNAVFVLQRSDGGAMNFMNASQAYGQFGTGNGYPVRILVNSMWRMSLNLDNSLTMVNGASCTAGGVWTDASSRELKENIEDLSVAEAEEALRELVPVKYNYKADKAERHVGFIAEDAPELVASMDRKTMSPMNVVGVLTKIVQEQQKTISELKDKVEKLERKGTLEK